jgi:SAM-dependent methyltransferase
MLREGMRILDVAPTPALIRAIDTRVKLNRVNVDLHSDIVDVKMNLEKVSFHNEVFDAAFCIHVLEHVYDDSKALDELYRVLKVGGWAILMVPIDNERETTDEGRDVIDPQERIQRFGQSDHLRVYGKDFVKRCELAGFEMDVIVPTDEIINRHAILPREKIYLGWRK